jgi:hypothetical protein
MADHSLGVAYAVRAVKLASLAADAEAAGDREHQWQRERLPETVRELVVSAQDQGTVLGEWQP